MGIANQLNDIRHGFATVASFPELKDKPIIIGESDPEGCAACSARVYPQNAYRNGTVYSSYTAAAFARKYDLALQHGVNLAGAVTWAFEFENQPWFDGFRDLATNGIEKPVLNTFRMFGLMGSRRVAAQSSAQAALDDVLRAGVRDRPDVGVLASRSPHSVSILVWHYHDDDVPSPDADVTLSVAGLVNEPSRVLARHYRVDHEHSNSWEAWKKLGSPANPTPEQYSALEKTAQLEAYEPPRWLDVRSAKTELRFRLPRQAVSLVELSW
jgi:xylan 1,4-beta-xylosidase